MERTPVEMVAKYGLLSSLDYRYFDPEIANYLSEDSYTAAKLRVEVALVKVLARRGRCSIEVAQEIEEMSKMVTTEDVYIGEAIYKHDVKAMVERLRDLVSPLAKPFVHLGATSYDIVDTANALRYKEAFDCVVIPAMLELEKVLCDLVLAESDTPQIGRTHCKHAVPITFGFALAEYPSRHGKVILRLKELIEDLRGKFSGAVGAYNALSLFFPDAEEFEREVLAELGLKPQDHSTQIVQPEPFARVMNELILAAQILTNLARDMRNLQRTEIAEVSEYFDKGRQTGSSAMPHKRNPISCEGIESICLKRIMPSMLTVYLDLVSDHQRDLTGSASSRSYVEPIGYYVYAVKKMTKTLSKMIIHRDQMKENIGITRGLILSEPLQDILSIHGFPNAYETARQLTLRAEETGQSLQEVVAEDKEVTEFLSTVPSSEAEILKDPLNYTGLASVKAQNVARFWRDQLKI